MKKLYLLLVLFLVACFSVAQNFNADKTTLSNFLVRMYKTSPYDVKVVNDYDHNYLISAVILNPTKYNGDESTMLRVANVKAMSQASRYFNGSNISADFYVSTVEYEDGTTNTETIEKIKEKSIGYVKQLEHLITFEKENGELVFLYCKEMN